MTADTVSTDSTAPPSTPAPHCAGDGEGAPAGALQPLLTDETVVLHAPVQVWSSADGTMGAAPIHGVWVGDTRVVSAWRLDVAGSAVETIAGAPAGAGELRTESLVRGLDDRGADPDVRLSLRRRVTSVGVHDELEFRSRLPRPVQTTVTVRLDTDASSMEMVKAGLGGVPAGDLALAEGAARWSGGGVDNRLTAPNARITVDGSTVTLQWAAVVPAGGACALSWDLQSEIDAPVVVGVTTPVPWDHPAPTGDDRLDRWLTRALDDLSALRMSTRQRPDDVFFAAGAPWFFTLFGRDSLWAARLMLPLDHTVAAGTLRTLAALQGTSSVPATAEQPGKIAHELRRETLHIPGEGVSLAPLYYGTIDATPLWICLLHDAWQAGMPEPQVRELLPHLQRALQWMRDFGDSDGDGFLEYVDETGHGLANQGWKDSGDSVQWRDGAFAQGPIALCEVQAYAYEAAVHGATLLDHFGLEGADDWRRWAARLRDRFRAAFWIDDANGAYPAIALDASKRAVDALTSNIGHLVGTGLLDRDEEAAVAARLVSPALNSGYGLRTMSTDDPGYWPLSYHRGSVWTHDTAIAIAGLLRAGLTDAARELASGLLEAAPGFDFRMPELHSGDAAADTPQPVPYPAACRPQAWSAAAVVPVRQALGATAG